MIEQLTIQLIIVTINIVNVFIDAYKIKSLGKNIKHGINFTVYAAILFCCIYFFKISGTAIAIICISVFCNRQLSFDIPLNLRRKLKWYYSSTAEPPAAIMDRIERAVKKKLNINEKKLVLIYLIIYLITCYLLLNQN